MKISMFHLMPYRDLPEDFTERYDSVWVDIPSDLFDPAKAHVMYNQSLDELEYGAAMGYDGICVNEHHSNAYGMMPSPTLMAASLARRTKDVAIIVLGTSVALYNPPVRVAEEYAMLDCISGGRIVAGFPVGSSQDSNFAYSVNPAMLRERYHEAADLIVRAWTDPDVFSWDGKFSQLRYVNIWPRPIQKPHPPVWVPGGRSVETWDWTLEKGYLYAYLSYNGYKLGKRVIDNFWKKAEEKNVEPNPYHAGFLQLVVVGESQSEIEEKYGPHVEYFVNKLNFHVRPGFTEAPGYRSIDSLKAGLLGVTRGPDNKDAGRSWKDIASRAVVVAGTPSQVTEQLEDLIKSMRIGHLMVLNQIGSMPHDLAMENIRLTATKVLPNLRHIWRDKWEDKWWPQPLQSRRPPAEVQ